MAEIQVLINPTEVAFRYNKDIPTPNDIFDIVNNSGNCLGYMHFVKFDGLNNALRMKLKNGIETKEIRNIDENSYEASIEKLLTSFNFVLRKDNG